MAWNSNGRLMGFAMMLRVGEAHEQVPPVEHQRDGAGHQAAALEIWVALWHSRPWTGQSNPMMLFQPNPINFRDLP
jgi:hypothetical protein